MSRVFKILRFLVLFLEMPQCICAYDAEIDGLRYEWSKTHNSYGEEIIYLVGYNSSKITENLTIPRTLRWESRDSRNGKKCCVDKISTGAFQNCSKLVSIKCNVEKLSTGAFQNCSKLVSVIASSNVNSGVFQNCPNLQSISISGYVGSMAFEGYTSLQSISIGGNVGSNAFENCTSLEKASLSSNSISSKAFKGCLALKEILVYGKTVPVVYDDSFDEETFKHATLIVPEGMISKYREDSVWSKFEIITDGTNSHEYSITISSIGNGSTIFNGTTINNSTNLFTLNEGTSATITFAPDNGYRIKSLKVNGADVTSNVLNNSYTVSNIKANTTVEVEFEMIPIPTYTLSVKATGNGSATYSGTTTKNNTQSFTLDEGSSATITFAPDNGYRIKSVKVNSADVTSSVSNNSYTVSNIKTNTTIEVEFEAIPIPTYILSVKAIGNGSATYNETSAKNNTKSFTLNEGTSATITFTPDNGYRIKSVKVNSKDVTSSVSNNQYIVSNIKTSTTVEVEFEAIPIPTYTLSVKASGNGSATYNGTTAKNSTQNFTLNEGTSATITFTPDNGYRIKSVKVNSAEVTSSVSDNSYTVSNIKANTTLEVEFEAIPIPTYTLYVKSTGNGSVTYNGTTAKNNTQTFTLNEGTSATITFTPDNGYRIKSAKVNSADVTSSVSNNSYTVSNIKANTTVEVEFEAIPIPTYTLSVKATGNGSATYSGTTAKNNTQSFTLNEGTSATITFAPDNGYRIKSVKVNSVDVTSSVSNNSYTVSNIKANTTIEVEFEAIPIPTYTLYVKATGNGSATYNETSAKNNTKSFTLNEGTSATITFAPDNGYRIKSVKVNSVDVTSSVSNNSYTVSNIKANTTIEVEFEAIPITTYTLSVKATGNGSATYDGTTAKNNTKTFTLNEGTSATITFTPDNGYRIKSVKVNSTDVTSKVSNNSYTISNISANTTLEVEFEAIPITTYTLSVKATGNGSATYDGTTAKNNTKTFTLNEGTSATITFTPDNGYRIKSVKVNSTDVTSKVANNSYTISNISANTTLEVEFEAIPITTYTLSVKATGNGTASYDGTTAKNNTQSFTLNEGTSVTITFSPDNGYRIKSVKVNSTDMTSNVSNNQYTISNIKANTTIEVEFEAIPISTYTLSIKATGNGSTTYDGTTAKNSTKTFTLNEGTSATITFNPDNGYRIKSVKVNSTDVTSSVANNSYTVSNIKANTTVEVEFEAIPVITYTLSVKAKGNGSATYDGTTTKNSTKTFTVNEGTNATITFSPDNGYRIKNVKVNSTDVTSKVSNNSYTISDISANTAVEVEFEAVPSPIVKSFEIDGINYKVGEDNTVSVTSGEGIYYDRNLVIPSQVTYDGTTYSVTSIGKDAFHHGSTITSLSIPSTVTSIGESAFGACTSLTSVSIPNSVKEIAPAAFYGCSALRNVILPSGLKRIDENLFWGCSSLTSVTIPKGVISIGEEAFRECLALPSITIPYSVTEIGERAFENCTSLKELISEIQEPSDIPENVFQNIASDAVLQVPQGTKTNYQQYDGWTNHFAKVKEEGELDSFQLTLSATGSGTISHNDISVEGGTQTISIEAGASATVTFHPNDGYRIKSATMNGREIADLSSMSYTIDIMEEDVTIEVEFEAVPSPIVESFEIDGIKYKVGENNTVSVTSGEGTNYDGNLVIPSQVTYEGTTYSVTSIGKDAFHHGSAITSVSIPSTVTSIGESAFGACTSLTSVSIPNSVKEIAPAVFYGCSALRNVILPSGLKIVDENLFWGCSSLTSVTIPEGVISIGEEAFRECLALPSITIPKSVMKIGERAFEDCTSLKEVISEIEEPSDIPENVFQNIASDAVLQVPQGTKTNYQQYDGWTKHFAKVKEVGELDSFQLTLSATGSGYVSYNDISVEGGTQTISIEAGASVTVTFHPNDGYRIKGATINGREIADLSSMSYTIGIMDGDVTIEVEFETIPVKKYTLKYVVDGETYKTYEIDEGAAITPEAEPTKEGYSFSGWSEIPTTMPDHDVTVTGTFTKLESRMTVDGINYEVVSFGNHTVVVADGDYGQTLEVPATVNNGNDTWTVMGLKDGALDQCENLAAVIWDPSAVFNARVSNPNLLLYVKDKSYASFGVNNVIVNGTAESIELTDASSGNDFYCPKAFKARKISYSHRYNMETGLGDSKGWETIVLPFDVQKYTSPKGEIVPFTKWSESDKTKPFWLFELTTSGYKDVEGIKANTPYIISMPNNPQYLADYVIIGLVIFSAENVEVKASDDLLPAKYLDRTFVPNYTNKAGDDYLALNVNSYYVTNPGTDIDGSKFIKGLRAVHPFEAYMTTTSNTRSIDVMDGMTTAIRNIMMTAESKDLVKVYDTKGVLVKTAKANDDLRKGLAAGVYIVNGKKMIIK